MGTVVKYLGLTFAFIVGGLALVFLWSFIIAWPVMWLWNWITPLVSPENFKIPQITYWTSWGLYLLCSILFKSSSSISSSSKK